MNSAAPLSGAFGGLLATGLAQIKYGGYNRGSTSLRMLDVADKVVRLAMDLLH